MLTYALSFPGAVMSKQPQRLSFPEAEARLEWLGPLLDAYHLTNQGVAEGIRRELAQGRALACGRGCGHCCEAHADIPVYPLELIGIYWYATEVLNEPLRGRLHDRLANHRPGNGCPFLLDGACAIHPMRPMACRNFNVFDRPCAAGEDAFHTRRQDVLTPLRRYQDEALERMLPFHGVKSKAARRQAIKSGAVHTLAKVLQQLDWSKLAERMDGVQA